MPNEKQGLSDAKLDIHIVSENERLLEILKKDTATISLQNDGHQIVFADKVTPQQRENFQPDQYFIVIDFIDATHGNAPWSAYERLVAEAKKKGAKVEVYPIWGNTDSILESIRNKICREFCDLLAAPATHSL